MSDNDGFLSRWSRRKLAEKEPDDAAEIPLEVEASVQEDAAELVSADADAGEETGEAAEPARHPAEDIDIDSLTKESDFTVFMEKGVPTAVRRQALRKLWTSDPVLANLDGLNDYEDMDFTYGISSVAKTDWKLGRGFLTDKDLGIEPDDEDGEVEEGEVADGVAGDGGADEGEEPAVDTIDDAEDAVAQTDDGAESAEVDSEAAQSGPEDMDRAALIDPLPDQPDPMKTANPFKGDKPRSA